VGKKKVDWTRFLAVVKIREMYYNKDNLTFQRNWTCIVLVTELGLRDVGCWFVLCR